MKRCLKMIAIALVFVLGIYAGNRYLSAEQAAVNCPEIQNCLAQGYWIETCEENPIYYLIPPVGNYAWGSVQTRLNCDQNNGTAGEPMVVTCTIEGRNRHGHTTFVETSNQVVPIR